MHQVTQKAILREMDAGEIEDRAAELVTKRNAEALNGEEIDELYQCDKLYKQLTGTELIVETKPQFAS